MSKISASQQMVWTLEHTASRLKVSSGGTSSKDTVCATCVQRAFMRPRRRGRRDVATRRRHHLQLVPCIPQGGCAQVHCGWFVGLSVYHTNLHPTASRVDSPEPGHTRTASPLAACMDVVEQVVQASLGNMPQSEMKLDAMDAAHFQMPLLP